MTLFDEIINFLHYNPGSGRIAIEKTLAEKTSSATIKRLLKQGASDGLINVFGNNRSTVYELTPKARLLRTVDLDSYYAVALDKRQMHTSYNFDLIRGDLAAIDIFTTDERKFLSQCEHTFRERVSTLPKSIYLKEMERLGIDLSWKSAEIEGNTYTLLETVNLLKDKIEAKGKKREEAIMLLNHKSALKAIVENPDWFLRISLARMEDIHSMLIDGLGEERNLRYTRVGISGTNYRPLEVESQIREAVEDMCRLVNGKNDPYEQALLTLLLIAYIQPFVDGNKRTSRLMSNALLVANGVCPLSFRTVEADDYRAALLLFYEQNNIAAFKKMFLEQTEFAMREYF